MANDKILVVDDEDSMCNFLSIMLKKEGYQITTAHSGEEALKKLDKAAHDVVISDLKMKGMNGLGLIDELNKRESVPFVIIMTAFATIESAIEALKKGAFDYITKPFKVDEIKLAVARALEQRRIRSENVYLKKQLHKKEAFGDIIGKSDAIMEVLSQVNGAVLNDEEVRHLCDTTNIITGARMIMDWGTDFVIVKKGEHGATLFTEDAIFPTCSFPLEEISDPTGAGDSFAGGFMGHIARRGDLSWQAFKEAVIYGNIMGSYVVEEFSVERLLSLTIDDIEGRYRTYREMVQF